MTGILFFGDIFGRSGRNVIKDYLAVLKSEFSADFCIANCENMAAGRGVTERTVIELFDAGIDLFTSGNHLWDKKESFSFISQEKRILRPANYPTAAIGNRFHVLKLENGKKLGVFCLMGQVYTVTCESPWRHAQDVIAELKKETNVILLDIHAEATGEKRAMGFYLDGKVSAIVGTHTHIQTADEEILPNGTAYITDVGMNGPHDSVIGVKKDIILKKQLTGMPARFEPAENGNQINAVFITVDDESGKALSITRIRRKLD